MDSAYSTAIDIDAKNTFIYNNIFFAQNGAAMGEKQMVIKNNGTALFMTNNLFYGDVINTFKNSDTHGLEGDPDFDQNKTENWKKYELKPGSPGINTSCLSSGMYIITLCNERETQAERFFKTKR